MSVSRGAGPPSGQVRTVPSASFIAHGPACKAWSASLSTHCKELQPAVVMHSVGVFTAAGWGAAPPGDTMSSSA